VLFEESLGGVATDLLDAVRRLRAGDLEGSSIVARFRDISIPLRPLGRSTNTSNSAMRTMGRLSPRAILTSFSTPVTPTCESPTETSGADA